MSNKKTSTKAKQNHAKKNNFYFTPVDAYIYYELCRSGRVRPVDSASSEVMLRKIIAQSAWSAIRYVIDTGKRFPEAEPALLSDANQKHLLDYMVIMKENKEPLGKDFVKNAESRFALNPFSAKMYASEVLGKRFIKGERTIATDALVAANYCDQWGIRLKAAEPAILKNPEAAKIYLESLLCQHKKTGVAPKLRSKFEQVIACGEPIDIYNYTINRSQDFLDSMHPDIEKAIAKDGEASVRYALHVRCGRFPEGEAAMIDYVRGHNSDSIWHANLFQFVSYTAKYIKAPWPELKDAFETLECVFDQKCYYGSRVVKANLREYNREVIRPYYIKKLLSFGKYKSELTKDVG